jgi:GNAT superfamily N-acetyltransferase
VSTQSEEMIRRIEQAERDAFLHLYRVAAESCGTHWYEADGVSVVWSPRDDDPGFSCVLNLADTERPAAVLAEMEREAITRGIGLIGIDGSPEVLRRIGDADLQRLGYAPEYQECMWGQRLSTASLSPPDRATDGSVKRVDPTQRDVFARALNLGYDLPDDAVRGQVFASTIGLPQWWHYLTWFDGEPGSASVLYVTAGVALLFVTTTVPRFRGRGAQTALIRQRLRDASEAGCDLATSQTVVDNASPRNMARHGFEPLYNRWIYGKDLNQAR